MIRNLHCYSEGHAQQDLLMEWTWGTGAREVKGELAFPPACTSGRGLALSVKMVGLGNEKLVGEP